MKIQYLAVIFIIIMMPIMTVFSEYIDTQIDIVRKEQLYDNKLSTAASDMINGFQINTMNTTLYTPQSRVNNIEASVNNFFDSLKTAFEHEGNLASAMKSYVPAVVFTLYDGYYVYSPLKNTLTNVNDKDEDHDGIGDKVDNRYKDGKIISGVKPFVPYSCRYKIKDGREIVITYSLDNYIYIDVFDNNGHVSKGGYLTSGISTEDGFNYTYNGVDFKIGEQEQLFEYLVVIEKIKGENEDDIEEIIQTKGEFYYATLNGTKYYYEGTNFTGDISRCDSKDYIFYIDEKKEKHIQVENAKNMRLFEKYYNRIFNNNSAYLYYKEAYEFTNWVLTDQILIIDGKEVEGLNLSKSGNELTPSQIVGSKTEDNLIKKADDSYPFDTYELLNVGNIFEGNIEYSNSNFNRHRADIIRAVITTNLSKAITGYKNFTNTSVEYIMPKISETDWELLENNVCVAAFLQGLKIGTSDKTYNNYAVVANNYTKEYIDENDICILTKENTYTFANDETVLEDDLIASNLSFSPGLPKINFRNRSDATDFYFNPVTLKGKTYYKSYTSYSGSSHLGNIRNIDMYRYINEKGYDKDKKKNKKLKEVYYTALGRERYGSYKYTINDII